MAEPITTSGLFKTKEEVVAYQQGKMEGTTSSQSSDAITTKLLNQNSLQLGLVAAQINNLNNQVVSLNTSLQAIGSGLATSQAIERQKEQAEQDQQQRLAQQGIREGQESVIEKKIENAAVAPAQKLATKAQFTLGNLGSFFLSLIGGWLTTQAIDAINAQAEGNSDKLNEIKVTVVKGLGAIVGTFVASNLALSILRGNFSRLGITFAALAAVGLFSGIGKDFINIVKNAAVNFYNDTIRNLPGGQFLPPAPEPEPGPDPSAPPGQQPPSQQPPSQQPPGPDPSAPPGAPYNKGGLVEGQEGIDQINARLTKGEFVVPKNVVDTVGLDFFQSLIDSKGSIFSTDGQQKSFTEPPISTANVEPTENMVGQSMQNPDQEPKEFIPSRKAGDPYDYKLSTEQSSSTESEQPANVEPGQMRLSDKNFMEMAFNIDQSQIKSFVDTENYVRKFGTLPTDMFTPISKSTKVAEKVSQPPAEAPINIVPITIPTSSGQPQQEKQPVATGGVGNVPFFSTNDSGNMYTLTTKTIFNVLPV